MKNFGRIDNKKSIVTKEYVDKKVVDVHDISGEGAFATDVKVDSNGNISIINRDIEVGDIPELPVSKIDGLYTDLSEKITSPATDDTPDDSLLRWNATEKKWVAGSDVAFKDFRFNGRIPTRGEDGEYNIEPLLGDYNKWFVQLPNSPNNGDVLTYEVHEATGSWVAKQNLPVTIDTENHLLIV